MTKIAVPASGRGSNFGALCEAWKEDCPARADRDRAIIAALESRGMDLVCLAGHMRLQVNGRRVRILDNNPTKGAD